jgi:hypothetical protein
MRRATPDTILMAVAVADNHFDDIGIAMFAQAAPNGHAIMLRFRNRA